MNVGGAPTPPNRPRRQVRWEDNCHGDSKQQTLPCGCQAAMASAHKVELWQALANSRNPLAAGQSRSTALAV